MRKTKRFIAIGAYALAIGACHDVVDIESVPTEVAVASPLWGSVLSGTVAVAASVTGDTPPTGVSFNLDGVGLGSEDTVPPFEVELDTRSWSNREYFLEARARTADGHFVRSSKVYVSILNTGTLRVHVSVPPGDEGPVAPTLTVDGQPSGRVPALGGTVDVPGLATGRHWVDLVQSRYDCTTVPGIVQSFDVVADSTTDLDIEVTCSAVPDLEIAFAANGDIYRSRLDGSGLVNVTNTPGRTEHSLDWSPDGSRLAYVVGEQIFVADADGLVAAPLDLPEGDKARLRWSPDGSQILFGNDDTEYDWWDECWYGDYGYYCGWLHRLYVVSPDSGTLTSVAVPELSMGFYDDLPGGWSSDGSRFVYERDTGICYLDVWDPADVAPPTTLDVRCANGSADWGPDDRIAFTVPGARGADLATVAPDGTGLTVLQASPYAIEHDPRWTPDGQWLVFLEDGRITVTGADGFGRYHALQQFWAESLSLVP